MCAAWRPTMQAYSLVGRSRNKGEKGKLYDADSDHRNFLYLEYLRIISRFQPLVFVMENVKAFCRQKHRPDPYSPESWRISATQEKAAAPNQTPGGNVININFFFCTAPPR